jgi:hypothetical protein
MNNTIPKAEKLHRYLFGDPSTTTCLMCGKPTKFINIWRGYSEYCSYKCSNKHDAKKAKGQATLMQNYGVTNPSKSEEIQATKLETNWEKYSAKHYMSSETGKAEFIKLNQEKYGSDWYVTTDEFKQKSKATCQQAYGVDHPHQTAWYWESCNPYNLKPYILSNGEEVAIQGYDGFLLDYLISLNIRRDDICFKKSEVPNIKYQYEGNRMYFPDAFVKSSNAIYEAKSEWTYSQNLERNTAKRIATINSGYSHTYVIFNNKGSVLRIF